MSTQQNIHVVDLLFDMENPRLADSLSDQLSILQAIASHQGKRLRYLAEDIVKFGLNPSDLFIVMASTTNDNHYIVLEGNRRLAALRALHNPTAVMEAVPSSIFNAFTRLRDSYLEISITTIPCIVTENRVAARHWIELKHTGQMQGAGTVLWGTQESSRFRAQATKYPELHIQALDFLQARGDITSQFRSNFPATTLKRLIDTPMVRTKMGLDRKGQQLARLGEEDDVVKI
ncbi:MAG: hypothetical protein F4Z18_04450, partial [Caldilineaceae bacterium SB0666_bin_21]|nr:hypothetical protein [Caldilineaceae bacterium SB0666_bin_21]